MTDGWHDRSLGAAALAALAAGADGAPGIAGLEFEVYLAAPEPIFTRPRGSLPVDTPGGPACVSCHTWQTNGPPKLEELGEEPDAEPYWSSEASRPNFLEVARLVSPGSPDPSRLLPARLAQSAGGRGEDTGGVSRESQDDPERQAVTGRVAAWVRGERTGSCCEA